MRASCVPLSHTACLCVLRYKKAKLSMLDRNTVMSNVIKSHLEFDLELLGITGVEDRLQVLCA